jgi:hypothetical protein
MILKMNFNFNFKDMPAMAAASIQSLTTGCDRHHMGKIGGSNRFLVQGLDCQKVPESPLVSPMVMFHQLPNATHSPLQHLGMQCGTIALGLERGIPWDRAPSTSCPI